ncbi:AAA family ATPase [Dolichospermum sp. ST_sed9]|nr:AAA family ATPase [Dolichospermum sp. ST_sed9]
MLKRIYIDNFRGLVNFELNIDSINLFLGGNGSGKSTVFEALRKIQTFISGDVKAQEIFKPSDCTRWQNFPIQRFELEITGNGGNYKYEFGIRYYQDLIGLEYEKLWFNGKNLLNYDYDYETGSSAVYFRNDERSEPSDLTNIFLGDLSMIAFLKVDHLPNINWFKNRMERFIIVQIAPNLMLDGSDKEEKKLTYRMDNFASWYRYMSQDQGKISELINVLKDVLDGFISFKFEQYSEKYRTLKLRFSTNEDRKNIIDYSLSELSDGQKVLIALYSLLYCTESEDYTLCIDEPENFLALPEIQPWLRQLYDFCDEGKLQALLISHHPECINYLLASPIGYWFERQSNAPVRVRKISNEEADNAGLNISELIARGWL